ncbi:MAG: hypothetical protein IJD64_03325 [Clostridia bacterium]|nr:hypothetical protein [Clostridia bacterium]
MERIRKIKQMKIFDVVLVVLSMGVLFFFCVGLFLFPQKKISEQENRMLRTWEAPSWQTLFGGAFSDTVGTVTRDQFPMREHWISVKARCEQILGKRENNRIFFGENGYLMARNEYVDLSTARENLEAVERFSKSSEIPVTRTWIPRAADVMSRWLPPPYPSDAARRLYQLLDGTPLNLLYTAAEDGRQIYYRTDHHLTTEGAYLLYCHLGKTLGYEPKERVFFSPQTVSEDFLGSADSRVGGIAPRADRIELYRYDGDERFLMTDRETGEVREGFYDASALEQKDQYAVFLGGNFAHLSVEDPTENDKPRLLLVKDSFANALVPFLAIHFDLEIVDLRYVSGEVFVEKCARVLILEGVDTLATDPSLGKLGFIKYKEKG